MLEATSEKAKTEIHLKLESRAGSEVAAIVAPFDVQEIFLTRGRVPVHGTINGFTFRSSLMPMGGCHMIAVNRAMRAGAKAKAGDIVDVVLERDDEERTVDLAPLLQKALAKSKRAAANWELQSYTNRKEMARAIAEAKQDETRVRRLTKVMDVLQNGKPWTG